jgi:hypothetical protein
MHADATVAGPLLELIGGAGVGRRRERISARPAQRRRHDADPELWQLGAAYKPPAAPRRQQTAIPVTHAARGAGHGQRGGTARCLGRACLNLRCSSGHFSGWLRHVAQGPMCSASHRSVPKRKIWHISSFVFIYSFLQIHSIAWGNRRSRACGIAASGL